MTHALLRRERPGRDACTACASTPASSRSPAPSSSSRPTSCCSPWASSRPVHEGMLDELGVELDPRGNVKADTPRLPHLGRQGLLRRRHAPRPVAGRLGDPRGPPGGARDRRAPHGRERTAALTDRLAFYDGGHLNSSARPGFGGRRQALAEGAIDEIGVAVEPRPARRERTARRGVGLRQRQHRPGDRANRQRRQPLRLRQRRQRSADDALDVELLRGRGAVGRGRRDGRAATLPRSGASARCRRNARPCGRRHG